MRVPKATHTTRPWRIFEFVADFRLEDVWHLPTPGDAGDFDRLVHQFPDMIRGFGAGEGAKGLGRLTRLLFAVRWKLGTVFGWDSSGRGLGGRVPTLHDRLPADLQARPPGPAMRPFSSLYVLDDEWAAELANRTVHAIIHLGWVPNLTGGYHGEMAIYVKPNGILGIGYMAAIAPFRHLIVYPSLMRRIERHWNETGRR